MTDLSLQQIVLRFCAIVLIATVHGVAVAAAAYALGDKGPRLDGRVSFNPLVHLDIFGTVSAVLFSIGWSKPVAVDPAALRSGRMGLLAIVLAALVATILFAMALQLLRPLVLPLLPDAASETGFALVETVRQLSLWFVLVNLLPLPPLTGGHVLIALLPRWREAFVRAQPYVAIALVIVAATGLLTTLLQPAYSALAGMLPGG